MHVALGYNWYAQAAGYHMERAFSELGHKVTYVGLPSGHRAGYNNATPLNDIIAGFSHPPDLYLWIDPAARYFPHGIEDAAIPTACYLIDVHLGKWRHTVARFFDAVFIAQKDYVNQFQHTVNHDQVYWLPLAAATDVHLRHALPKVYDVGFVGNISVAHRRTARERRLQMLRKRVKMNEVYRSYTPEEVGRVYSQSRIVFNTSIAGDVTMRVFEGTASGALLLTDQAENGLGELFRIGREIVIYRNDADLLDKVTYYLEHEYERTQIAEAGYKRTHAEHTYMHRVQQILDTVRATGFQQCAPMRSATRAQRYAARHEVYTHLHMLETILDDARAAGYNPLKRLVNALPTLLRRLIF